MPPPGERLWFCLRAQPKRERIAYESLLRLGGVEALLPLIRYSRLRKGKRVWAIEPLFPGYLFARFEPLLRLNAVRYAQGVAKVVHFGGRYPLIPPGAADELRKLLGPENLITLDSSLEPGMEVQIGAGPLCGLHAIIREFLPGKERVRILLNWLGRQLEAEISPSDVEIPDPRIGRKIVLCNPTQPISDRKKQGF
ncbi:Transcription antitermination protein RfaH [Methylacidimicrobium cyclopophantes]|uniref:Transcription antitermination protein RfaH n=1 Tax=Methylacidimicrobium cyclopophantes TaxID=1041766 RepID=A0A5E6MIB7_9BACT|nr:transcription termination/antitermination NusG family protein [Methylacidimicrobium cyclopophantes]VVM07660.1 Transcription antitermination protein RfaH [Methylacidimicrobium cyclopophantes]